MTDLTHLESLIDPLFVSLRETLMLIDAEPDEERRAEMASTVMLSVTCAIADVAQRWGIGLSEYMAIVAGSWEAARANTTHNSVARGLGEAGSA